jgi:hypothetical protein
MKRKDKPREYTMEEVREIFLNHVNNMVHFWNDQDEGNQLDRLNGLAFSILAALDGASMAVPYFIVAPNAYSGDKNYHKERGENWFPPNDDAKVRCSISGCLHEIFCNKDKPNG